MIRYKHIDKLPILYQIEGVDYKLPRFNRANWATWESEEMQQREAAVRKQVPDVEQWARIQLMFPVAPLTKRELYDRVSTIAGTGRVLRTCFEKGGVPAEVIKRIVDEGQSDEIEMGNLALMLCGLISEADVARHIFNEKVNGDGGEKKESERRDDPLTPARPALQI